MLRSYTKPSRPRLRVSSDDADLQDHHGFYETRPVRAAAAAAAVAPAPPTYKDLDYTLSEPKMTPLPSNQRRTKTIWKSEAKT